MQIKLLKDVLEAWKSEVEKKPPLMTVEEAYKNLGLTGSHHEESTIRKAYYKLAQMYHPDKNPDGRVDNTPNNEFIELNFYCILGSFRISESSIRIFVQ